MARPAKWTKISKEVVFQLAKCGCAQDEIAGRFGVSISTISRRFAKEYHLGLAACKTRLRSKQVERALNGSDKMLIHLGKNLLGQTDRVDVTTRGEAVTRYVERAANPRDIMLAHINGQLNGNGESSNGNNGVEA